MRHRLPALVLLPFAAASLGGCAHGAKPTTPDLSCSSTKEYVTTLEFLRDQKDLAVPDPEARAIARQVVDGCSGAGKRFIHATLLLTRSGLAAQDAIKTAIELARRSDVESEAFTTLFEYSILSDYLDLDLKTSFQKARLLSIDFKGDPANVRDDFSKLVKFCVGDNGLDLPRPVCADFATRITEASQNYQGTSIAEPFFRAFDFIRSSHGPGLSTGTALKMAEEVVTHGPGAADNFIQGYRYAVSKSGLGLDEEKAIQFANELAVKSELKSK